MEFNRDVFYRVKINSCREQYVDRISGTILDGRIPLLYRVRIENFDGRNFYFNISELKDGAMIIVPYSWIEWMIPEKWQDKIKEDKK